jgi:acetyltransferase-like isoleucine patch superfamily enzyme
MSVRRSAFARPLVYQPPGAHEPVRLLAVRAMLALVRQMPRAWSESSGFLSSFRRRLELAELWRTDLLAFRVQRARQMGARVGEKCRLYSLNIASEAELVEIGDNVIVSGDVTFVTHDGAIFTAIDKFPGVNGHYGRIKIGNGCFLGIRAIIMPGIELGDNCIVAAGAVVTDSFAANSVIAGNPATYVCPTSMYLELKRHSPATVFDSAHPFPMKLPPELLAAHMADVPLKLPRRRDGGTKSPRTAVRAVP